MPRGHAHRAHDAWGHATESTDGRGTLTTRIYRADNRLESETAVNGNQSVVTSLVYDEGGDLKSVTQGGITSTYNTTGGIYRPDPYGLVRSKAQVVAGVNLTMAYEYDNRQRLTQAVTPDSIAANYGYNQMGQLTTLNGWVTDTLKYDTFGRLDQYQLANGVKQDLEYDSQDRLQSLEYSQGTDILKAYDLSYDKAGNITSKNQNVYSYDQLNRLVGASEKGWFQKKSEDLNLSYATAERDYDGQAELNFTLAGSTQVNLDNASRSVGIDLGDVYGVNRIELTPTSSQHRVRARDLKFYTKTNPGDEYTRLTGWSLETRPDGSQLIKLKNVVDARYVKIATVWDDRNEDNQNVESKSTFSNLLNLLVKVGALSKQKTESYEYDAAGNRTKLTVDAQSKTSLYYLNAQGKNLSWLATNGEWYYSYDNNGNLITKAKQATVNRSFAGRSFTVDTSKEYWTYSWDLKNRLSSVSKNGALVVSYTYDADNLRVARTKGAETTVYAYGRNGALTYQKNLATGKARTYAYLGSEVVGWTDTAADGTQTKMWALTDQLGSVTKVTNAAAEVVWSSEYNPFGKTAGIEGLYDFDGSYAGHQPDNDVGLIYMWNRWQDPETGRFISEDSARAGSNWYSYAHSNPLRFTDPTGLATGQDYYEYYMATTEDAADPEGDDITGDGKVGPVPTTVQTGQVTFSTPGVYPWLSIQQTAPTYGPNPYLNWQPGKHVNPRSPSNPSVAAGDESKTSSSSDRIGAAADYALWRGTSDLLAARDALFGLWDAESNFLDDASRKVTGLSIYDDAVALIPLEGQVSIWLRALKTARSLRAAVGTLRLAGETLLPESGAIINGRYYSKHALERMAPDTPEVRAILEARAAELYPNDYKLFKKYVDPRGIPVSVVENAIKFGKRARGDRSGTWVQTFDTLQVILNDFGGVITVIP